MRKPIHKLHTLGTAGLLTLSCLVSAEAANVPERYVAEYRYAGGERELAELRAELDRVAEQFASLVRPVARQRLYDRIGPYSEVQLDAEDGTPFLKLGSQDSVPCDGTWQSVENSRGEKGHLACRFDKQSVMVSTKYERGSRSDEITFVQQGEFAHIASVVESPKLPDEIRFELTYAQD